MIIRNKGDLSFQLIDYLYMKYIDIDVSIIVDISISIDVNWIYRMGIFDKTVSNINNNNDWILKLLKCMHLLETELFGCEA